MTSKWQENGWGFTFRPFSCRFNVILIFCSTWGLCSIDLCHLTLKIVESMFSKWPVGNNDRIHERHYVHYVSRETLCFNKIKKKKKETIRLFSLKCWNLPSKGLNLMYESRAELAYVNTNFMFVCADWLQLWFWFRQLRKSGRCCNGDKHTKRTAGAKQAFEGVVRAAFWRRN